MNSTRRLLTQLHEVELSSVCNLACVYCPHPGLERPKAHMPWDTFMRVLEHIEHYCRIGSQGEVALTGIGEAILHPNFEQAVREVRRVIGPVRPLTLSTNGVAVDAEVVRVLAEHQVWTFVSLHRPEVASPAIDKLIKAGVRVTVNHAFVDSALDWAGQVQWHSTAARGTCEYLRAGWGVVRQDGAVVACCMDAHDRHPIGHVADAPGTLSTAVIPLCAACHRIPPLEMAA